MVEEQRLARQRGKEYGLEGWERWVTDRMTLLVVVYAVFLLSFRPWFHHLMGWMAILVGCWRTSRAIHKRWGLFPFLCTLGVFQVTGIGWFLADEELQGEMPVLLVLVAGVLAVEAIMVGVAWHRYEQRHVVPAVCPVRGLGPRARSLRGGRGRRRVNSERHEPA